MNKLLCIVPARGGSKGIKKKNLALLHGKPLLAYTLDFLLKEKVKADIAISTDSPEIARFCQKYPVKIIKRPRALAQDSSPLQEAWHHALISMEKERGSYLLTALLEPTSPFRPPGLLKKAIKKLEREKLEAVVTVYEVTAQRPEFLKVVKGNLIFPYKKSTLQQRQALRGQFVCLDGSLLCAKTEVLKKNIHRLQTHAYLGKKVGFLLQPFPYFLDIDTPQDLKLAELILKHWIFSENSLKR